jgi:hypothetical protein
VSFRSILIWTSGVAVVLLIAPFETLLPFATIVDAAAHIRTGIAEALLIAVFLALTVDSYVKKRLIEDIAVNVSSYMMVSELPAILRQEFHELTRIHLYRTLDLFYKIERTTDQQIILTGEATFTLFNVRGETEPYRHYVAVQKPFAEIHGHKCINNITGKGVLNAEGHVANYEEEATADKDLGAPDVTGTYMECFRDVFIPKRGQADFFTRTTQVLPDQHEEIYVNVMPGTHTIVRVDYPADMSVTVHFGHRLRNQVRSTPRVRPTQWTLEYGILPYQPIIIEWRKTKPPQKLITSKVEAAATATASTAQEPKTS